MGFVKVISTKDLKSGDMMGVEANDKEIFLANLEGKYYAMGNRCTHMGCMLSDGTLKGENVTCSCHGSVFNVKNGAVVKGPAKKPETGYEVSVDGEQLMVNL